MPGRPTTPRHRWGAALLAALLIAAIPAVAVASPPAAACQEYVVCGQPSGGPSGDGTVPSKPRQSRQPPRPGPQPSVVSRTHLPLTSYPLTPAIAIPAIALVAGLVGGLVIGVGRRRRRGGDGPAAVATSARAR